MHNAVLSFLSLCFSSLLSLTFLISHSLCVILSFLHCSISVSQSHVSPYSAVVALLSGPLVLECRRVPWSKNVAYKYSVRDQRGLLYISPA